MSPLKEETQRLFFALWPPPKLSQELFTLGGEVLQGSAGRSVAAKNIHMTLAFLGSINVTSRECAEQVASNLHVNVFTLSLEQVGCWSKSGILWTGPKQAPETLGQLVRRLNSGLKSCGHEAEPRPYAAHLTLARDVRPCIPTQKIAAYRWKIDRFYLAQSHARREGVRYEILREWRLNKPES